MSAPFFKYGLFNDEVSLVVAVFIGIGFGFFLERAGFGNGRKLAAQFYFTDMTVLKVMFTAIVTAMIGVYYLSVLGVLDLSLVYINPTYLAPQIVGGLILGIGFVIGGYCPGTACVSASTGRYDGWAYVGGLFAGILFFGEVFKLVEKFYVSTAMGKVTLPQLLHLPYGLMVFLVCVMALGAFAAAEWGEKKMAAKKEGE
ncbi:MAG TPA: YeeE/YedE thiosulfate transporter family protein [bacterium]|nr:YeeE/YedE thiosulfate transporter family protein [bacterium]HQG45338.1 YeeE/YedE thiosulfate transporter family protein [bacterium]HQI47981.1 YeeE/YedE thiosulfate transporter family protein [bacterium]HQJ65618.1 YeeE/YedE thiosulfate transporter family protein [bacterium]